VCSFIHYSRVRVNSTSVVTTKLPAPAVSAVLCAPENAEPRANVYGGGRVGAMKEDASCCLETMREELKKLAVELDTDPDMEWKALEESAAEQSQQLK
jgi:hypothetical protein